MAVKREICDVAKDVFHAGTLVDWEPPYPNPSTVASMPACRSGDHGQAPGPLPHQQRCDDHASLPVRWSWVLFRIQTEMET